MSSHPCSIPKRSDEAGGVFQASFSDGTNGLSKCGKKARVIILKLRSCPAVCVEDGHAGAIAGEQFIENPGLQVADVKSSDSGRRPRRRFQLVHEPPIAR